MQAETTVTMFMTKKRGMATPMRHSHLEDRRLPATTTTAQQGIAATIVCQGNPATTTTTVATQQGIPATTTARQSSMTMTAH